MTRLLPALAVALAVVVTSLNGTAKAEEDMAALAWMESPTPAPEVEFTVENGEIRSLADYRGKVIVLNFWAIWCPPCRDEMPSLDRLQASHGSDHFMVMAMSEDRGGEEVIREFYDEIEATALGVFSDPTQRVARDFRVRGMPTTFIIDHNGNLVAKLVGTAEWDSAAALSHILPLVEVAAAEADGFEPEQASLDAAD